MVAVSCEIGKLRRLNRMREVIALKQFAAMSPEPAIFLRSLYAFRQDSDAQASAKRYDALANCLTVALEIDVGYEFTVDLQLIELQLFQIRQAGIAGAKIVD